MECLILSGILRLLNDNKIIEYRISLTFVCINSNR